MNGRAGSASLCRFPINAGPGDVIQFEPINPIRNSYDMSGYLLSQFRVELLDENALELLRSVQPRLPLRRRVDWCYLVPRRPFDFLVAFDLCDLVQAFRPSSVHTRREGVPLAALPSLPWRRCERRSDWKIW